MDGITRDPTFPVFGCPAGNSWLPSGNRAFLGATASVLMIFEV
jgi:hypothetical protein